MLTRWIALLAVALALGGCASSPQVQTAGAESQWNDGVWNSVLGYVGPASSMIVGGP